MRRLAYGLSLYVAHFRSLVEVMSHRRSWEQGASIYTAQAYSIKGRVVYTTVVKVRRYVLLLKMSLTLLSLRRHSIVFRIAPGLTGISSYS